MVVSETDRGRDAVNARPHDTEKRGFSMHNQFTTSPLFGDPRLPARFWAKVRLQPDGCWLWVGTLMTGGYAHFWWRSRNVKAARLIYERMAGSINPGLQIDHLCRNRACVNPGHLEAVTQRTNILRGQGATARRAVATRCPRDHPYDLQNTHFAPDGYRRCRACRRLATARYREKRRTPC